MGIPIHLQHGAGVALSDASRWRDTTDALWRYWRRDFSDFRDQLEALYPESFGDMVQRTMAFVWRVAREMSTFYVRPPRRQWRQSGGGAFDPLVTDRIDLIYKVVGADRSFRTAQEQVRVLGNSTMWIWPVPAVQGARVLFPPPHHQEVELEKSDPFSHDVKDVKTWWVRVPVRTNVETGFINYAVARITKEEAIWEDGPMKGEGVWQADKANPLGEIPVLLFRSSTPAMGEWWAQAPEDMLDAQRAICHDLTDIGTIARLQGFGQMWLRGSQQDAEQIKKGPMEIIASQEPEFELGYAHGNPPLKEYLASLEDFMKLTLAANGLNPATVLKSSAITAVAKQMEVLDREIDRAREATEFLQAEQRFYKLLAAWFNAQRGRDSLPPDAQVEVAYREPHLPVDPLHDAQARRMDLEDGLMSSAETLAKRETITEEDARERIEENLKALKAQREIYTPDNRITQGRTPGTEEG